MSPVRVSKPSRSSASDQRLAKRAAGGDPEAFAAIFRRFQGELYRFCVAILREPQDAQDAVQNTMVKAMRTLPGEQREMQLRPWLYRIAHNEAIELRRRERTVERLGLATENVVPGTEERVEQGARLRTVLADIADLPERQRATLVMRELNGFDIGEIGAVLDISSGAVRQALYEARRGLGQMESGRDMDCADAMRQVSDGDGRVGRRGVRAHLRDCAHCRHFQVEVHERKRALASVAPLPALAAAEMLNSVLGGSSAATGGALGAGGGAGVAVGTGSGSGFAAVAGSAGASALVKTGAGLLALLAVGGAAADHGALLSGGGDAGARTVSRLGSPPPAVSAGDAPRTGGHGGVSRTTERVTPPPAPVSVAREGSVGRGNPEPIAHRTSGIPYPSRQESAPPAPVLDSAPTIGPATTTAERIRAGGEQGQVDEPPPPIAGDAEGEEARRPEGEGRPASPAANSPRGPSTLAERPVHPVHPAHPVHPENPLHPEHSSQGGGPPASTSEGAGTAAVAEPASAEEAGTPAEVTEVIATSSTPSPVTEPAAAPANGKAKGHEKQAATE